MTRPSADEAFMLMAWAASTRATCARRKVGAVLVTDTEAVFSGFNGSPRGLPHCTDRAGGCEMAGGHCVGAVHAEVNAVVKAARSGGRTDGSTLYTTASPCRSCMGVLVNAGVRRVVYATPYRIGDSSGSWAFTAASAVGIVMEHLPVPPHVVPAGTGQPECAAAVPAMQTTNTATTLRILTSPGSSRRQGSAGGVGWGSETPCDPGVLRLGPAGRRMPAALSWGDHEKRANCA